MPSAKRPKAIKRMGLAIAALLFTLGCRFATALIPATPTANPEPTQTPTATLTPTSTPTLTPTPIAGLDVPAVIPNLVFADLNKQPIEIITGDLKFQLVGIRTVSLANPLLDIDWRWEGKGEQEIWLGWIAGNSLLECGSSTYKHISFEPDDSRTPSSGYLSGYIKFAVNANVLEDIAKCQFKLTYKDGEYSIPVRPLIHQKATPTTASPAPKKVENTPTRTPNPALTVPAVTFVSGTTRRCGNLFEITISAVRFERRIRNNIPAGIFLVIELQLRNLTQTKYDYLYEEDYEVRATINSQSEIFPSAFGPSFDLYFDLSMNNPNIAFYVDDVPAGAAFQTLVAFDVNPTGKNWTLLFHPDIHTGNPDCQAEIPLQ